MFTHPDAVILFSAGNKGAAMLTQEGVAKNVLTVGATENYDDTNSAKSPANVAAFSSRGPTTDLRIKPDVLAPGDPITSVDPGTTSGLLAKTGTSQANAIMAASAAIVRQYYAQGWYPGGANGGSAAVAPSSALVRATMLVGSVPVTGLNSGLSNGWPNGNQGWGRAQLDKSLRIGGAAVPLRAWDIGSRSVGTSWSDTVTVTDSTTPLVVSAAWNDCAGTPGVPVATCAPQVLVVTSPSGTIYVGDNFSPQSFQSNAGGAPDVHDVIQQVRVNAPATGAWTFTLVSEGNAGATGIVARGGFT